MSSSLRSEFLALATTLCLAACAAQPSSAPAPAPAPVPGTGATSQIDKDAYDCRVSAEAEADRRYPVGANYTAWGGYGTSMSQTQDWVNRGNTRDATFNNCMTQKGYSRQQYENLRK